MRAIANSTLIRTAHRHTLAQIRHITAVRPAEATRPVADIYARVERDLGLLAPQIALHSPAPGPLAAAWLMLRESLVATGRVDRTTKEAVAAIVSLGNGCGYCVDLHTATLDALGEVRDADGRADARYDHGVRRMADWARATRSRAASARHTIPLPAGEAPELIGVVVAANYLARMANVFLPESPVPAGLPGAARGRALGLLGRILLPGATALHAPGAEQGNAPLSDDLDWAAGSPSITAAFAGAAAEIDAAGARSVPAPVRDLVLTELSTWDGRPLGSGRAWVGDLVSGLPFAQRGAARLALLTAMASTQVDRSVIDGFRRGQPEDRALVELTSWASLAAARQLGAWVWAAATGRVAAPV